MHRSMFVMSLCTHPMQSIVMPVHNGAAWLDEALSSVLEQTFTGTMELSVFNDASTVSMHASLHVTGPLVDY